MGRDIYWDLFWGICYSPEDLAGKDEWSEILEEPSAYGFELEQHFHNENT